MLERPARVPVTSRRVTVGTGVQLDVLEAGRPSDPVVVLLHGFPESSHSWRHQLGPIADAGFHVLAPDQRGYGGSSSPGSVEAYRVDRLTNDVRGLLDDVGAARAVVVGHDWGGVVAWHMGQLHPRRCRALAVAAAPLPQWPAPPTQVLRQRHGDRFFYILYFQEMGIPDAELDAEPERFLRAITWSVAGESGGLSLSSPLPYSGTGMISSLEARLDRRPDDLPPWLSRKDFEIAVDKFRKNGFFGPVSWYRNFDSNYELTRDIPPSALAMPTAFIVGERDPMLARAGVLGQMADVLPNFHGSTVVPEVGHWIQEEAPEEFNRWLLAFLDEL